MNDNINIHYSGYLPCDFRERVIQPQRGHNPTGRKILVQSNSYVELVTPSLKSLKGGIFLPSTKNTNHSEQTSFSSFPPYSNLLIWRTW